MAILKYKNIKFLYIDIMRDYIWPFYHRWILHQGKYGVQEWLACRHHNPFNILTPKLWERQVKGARNVEI